MDAFLEEHDLEPKELTSANKVRYEPPEALEMAREMKTIYAAHGKSVVEITVKDADEELLTKHLIGRSGKLRSPIVRRGMKMWVGMNEDAFAETLG